MNDAYGLAAAGGIVVVAVGLILKDFVGKHIGLPDRVLSLELDQREIKKDTAELKTASIEANNHLQYIRGAIDKMAQKEK